MSITLPGSEPNLQTAPHCEEEAERTQTIARALCDPHRYEILRLLAGCDEGTPCSCLRERVPLAPPTLSHHMKELRDAGLVEERREGRTVHYTLRRDTLNGFLEAVRRDLRPA